MQYGNPHQNYLTHPHQVYLNQTVYVNQKMGGPPVPGVQRPKNPEEGLVRALSFRADNSGCGHWRMVWPEYLLNIYNKANVQGGTVMIFDRNFYRQVKTVRFQRQATEQQLEFVRYIKNIQKEENFNIIYEIDDIIFREDIPHYNKFRFAFTDDKIRNSSSEIMKQCDEITVTCDFMKEYYMEKTGNQNITVIPNFIPRFWMDRFYDPGLIARNFEDYKRRPRVLYAGSGAHFDVDNNADQKDDFHHVHAFIRKTVNDYRWIFIGACPLSLIDLVRSGKIEMHKWVPLMDYPRKVWELNVNLMYAPLIDNTFNRAKSDLKYIESCAYGIPCICQDICTYANARHKFNTGDEMMDKIKWLLSDRARYKKESKLARRAVESRWMEDNIDYYTELYRYPFGDPRRKKINQLNGIKVK